MKEIVLSHGEILQICEQIGKKLTKRLEKERKLPVFLCVMRGALNFTADLMKNVKRSILFDYIQARSYSGTSSTGKIAFDRDVSIDISGRVVVVIEDVIDTGLTMKTLKEHLQKKGPKEIIVCSLLDKPSMRKVQVEADYVGKVLEKPKFVVGYGLDYRDLFRNVPYVYVPDEEEIKKADASLIK